MRRFAGARAPLVACVIATALLTSVSAVALHESDRTVLKDAQERLDTNRDSAIRSVGRQAADLTRTIQAFAGEPSMALALTGGTPRARAEAQTDLALLAQSKGAPAVVLTDVRGRALVVGPARTGMVGKDLSSRDWFQGARRTGTAYVSKAYRSIAPGRPLVVGIATPVVSHGKPIGYLAILGQLDQVRAVAEGARRDDGVTIAVRDQAGQLLTAPATASGDLTASAPVPGLGWTVSASLARATALAPAIAFRNNLALTLGAALLLVVLFTGIAVRSARRRAWEHDEVALERARLTALFADSPIGILECEPDGVIVSANEALNGMLGYADGELTGQRAPEVLQPHQTTAVDADIQTAIDLGTPRYQRERFFRAKNGTLVPVHTNVIVVREASGGVRNVVAFVVDQRQQKRVESALRASEERLTQLALHDDLTGLPNRRLLFARCTAAFEAARVEGSSVTALFIDLDGFKPVNDAFGHETGDQLLVDIADDLRGCLRPEDTVARVGGDEFVILLSEPHQDVPAIAARAASAVRRTVGAGHRELRVTASVGVATVDLGLEPDARPDQLLSRADAAMYLAKERGPGRHEVYRSTAFDVPEPRMELPAPHAAL